MPRSVLIQRESETFDVLEVLAPDENHLKRSWFLTKWSL